MAGTREYKDPPPLNGSATGSVSSRQFTLWVYGLAAVLIFLSCGSLTLIAHFAWRAADRHALETAQIRFLDTIEDQYWEITRRQMMAVQKSSHLGGTQPQNEKAIVGPSLAAHLVQTFGSFDTYVLEENDLLVPLFESVTETVSETQPNQQPLVSKIKTAFRSPWIVPEIRPLGPFPPPFAVFDASVAVFSIIDEKPALLSAIPFGSEPPSNIQSDEPQRLLVKVVYLGDPWFKSMSDHYGFHDLTFSSGPPDRPHPTQLRVYGADGVLLGYFNWDHLKPGLNVWMRALPVILLLGFIIALISVFIARKIGRLYATLEQSERKNHYFARHDSLTGLPNRHHFSDRLAYAIDSLPENHFAVVACDLDLFKPINDTYGHEAGDKVLQVTATRLQTITGDDGIVGRIGGDEFILLLTGHESTEHLVTFANRLLDGISKPIEIAPETEVTIGISLGIALAPQNGSTEAHLIRAADTALYQAKSNGRSTFFFAPQPDHLVNKTKTTHLP